MRKRLLAAGLCAALLFSGCSLSSEDIQNSVQEGIESAMEDTDTEQASVAPKETEAPEEKVVSMGEKGTVGDWSFKVTKAQVKKKLNNGKYYVFKAEKGQEFVIVSATVTNKGKEDATFLPRMGYSDTMITAKLYYQDYEYKATDLLNYDKDLLEESIKPLGKKKGIIAFEVPKKIAKKKGKMTLRIGTESESVTYKLK